MISSLIWIFPLKIRHKRNVFNLQHNRKKCLPILFTSLQFTVFLKIISKNSPNFLSFKKYFLSKFLSSKKKSNFFSEIILIYLPSNLSPISLPDMKYMINPGNHINIKTPLEKLQKLAHNLFMYRRRISTFSLKRGILSSVMSMSDLTGILFYCRLMHGTGFLNK